LVCQPTSAGFASRAGVEVSIGGAEGLAPPVGIGAVSGVEPQLFCRPRLAGIAVVGGPLDDEAVGSTRLLLSERVVPGDTGRAGRCQFEYGVPRDSLAATLRYDENRTRTISRTTV